MTVQLSQQELESYLWGAARLLRGLVDAGDYKQYIFPLLFFKRLSDVWDEEHAAALAETKDENYARSTADDRFTIPDIAHWTDVRSASRSVSPTMPQRSACHPPTSKSAIWPTCSLRGKLSFHWKCMMAPTAIIDYIVVHELCHLHHRDHTEAYWNEVDKVLPDYRERKEWLRMNGAGLDV